MKKILILLAAIAAVLLVGGCQSPANLARQLKDFEQLGVTEVEVTGKFSHTKYKVTVENGERTAELDHNNAWLPLVRVVRKTPAPVEKQ